jgi:Protein of unknown function (DUF2911)
MEIRKYLAVLGVIGGVLAGTLSLAAQEPRVSPHETVSDVIQGDRVMVVYGRPYTKDPKSGAVRKIWGGVVPYGEPWRTGADEATLLVTQSTIAFGATRVPAGAYTMRILPNADGSAKLIINKQIGQWGIGPGSYDPKLDLARIDLKKDVVTAPVDQFTIGVGASGAGGVLTFAWEKTRFSAPFSVQK